MTATRATRWPRPRATTPMPWSRPTRAPRWRWRRPAAARGRQTWVGARLRARDGTPVAGRWVAVSVANAGDVWAVTDDAGGVRLFGRAGRRGRPARAGVAAPGRVAGRRRPPLLKTRDHRRDRQRQVAGRDAVAELGRQRLAREAVHVDRDLRGRQRIDAARQQRADDAAQDVAAARRGQRRAGDRADERAPVGRRDHRARALEHDDRARRGRQPPRDARGDPPGPPPSRCRRGGPSPPGAASAPAAPGAGASTDGASVPSALSASASSTIGRAAVRGEPPDGRAASPSPVGIPGPIAIACARAASAVSAATASSAIDVGAARVTRRHQLDHLGVQRRLPGRRRRHRHQAGARAQRRPARPAPPRPVFPGEPATTSRWPELPLCADGRRRGSRAATPASSSR